MSNRICLFASYNSTDELPPDTKHFLRQLYLCGWETHLAISGKEKISKDIHDFCQKHSITPHSRPNQGLDFGAWQDLIIKNVTDHADYILLTNDSIFGPIYPLQPVFKKMFTKNLDIWGMVDSFEVNWHFQSWFLCFNHTTFFNPAIQDLFMQPFKQMDRQAIIQQGELKLGRILQSIPEIKCKAAWSPTKTRLFRNKKNVNPMHLDWYTILHSDNVPFIKKELIRDNHFGIFWLNYYRTLLKHNQFFKLNYIDTYLNDHINRPMIPHTVWWKRLKYLAITYDTKLAWTYFIKQGVSCSPPL